MAQTRVYPYLVLLCGVLIVSSASIMIRFAQNAGIPSLEVAAGRLGLAALILLPIVFTRARADIGKLTRRDLMLGMASGSFLALHFATWISSLEYTSVASSVALVATNPLWVGLASVLLFRERLGTLLWVGIGLTIVGSALIGISDSAGPAPANALLGNGLALLGAITGSGYFLIGRELRRHMHLLPYIWLSYTTAAVVLLVMALLGALASGRGLPLLGYPPEAYLLLLGLAIGPQLLGHTSFNWALRYLSATFITIAILGEPIGSAVLALLIFGEQFASLQLAGFVVVLIGITIASQAEQRPKAG